jgi:hypothetical protein
LIVTRVGAISTTAEAGDAEYAVGLRAAVVAAIDYALLSIERGGGSNPLPIPVILFSQARLAARSSISLDTVLRRYFAGHAVFGDFVVREARRLDLLCDADFQAVLRSQSVAFDRLVACVSNEHRRELQGIGGDTSHHRRARLVRRLLDGELLDATELSYEFDSHHLGVVASGRGATEAVRATAAALDRRLLLVPQGEDALWAWFGGRRSFNIEDVTRSVSGHWPADARLAIGEPAQGASGWRLTHRQAVAAAAVADSRQEPYVRYAEVALVASALHDELLATSLRRLYLEPLSTARDGGASLRLTLRAYFAARRNISSTAKALRVARQTVVNRLATVERYLDQQIDDCVHELVMALDLDSIDRGR